MSRKIKTGIMVALGVVFTHSSFAQTIIPLEILNNTTLAESSAITPQYNYHNKKLPVGFEKEVLTVLPFFPELKNVPVKFKEKKSFATLKTRPTFISMFMPKGHRTYVITISDKTIQKLTPLTFNQLPEAARMGIIGHELSHVVDFSKKSTWQSFKTAIGHLSKHYMDSLEYHTDKICIEHGLGKNLEAWSSYIRNTMHTPYWGG